MNISAFDIAVNRSFGEWTVNGHSVDDDVQEFLRDKTECEIREWKKSNCPHCGHRFTVKPFDDVVVDNEKWHNNRSYVFRRCSHCAHWEFHGYEGGNKCMDHQDAFLLSAVAARFNKKIPEGCAQELAQYLRRNPSLWHEIQPKRFEELVTDIFKANYHDAEAIHVGKPFDRGIDIIFVESAGTRWLIQTKRREQPNRAEGFATLQSILGAMALDGARHGIVVSTADSFSYHAYQGRSCAEQQGFVVEFIDKGILNRMITPLLPKTPWGQIFNLSELSYIEKDVQRHFWGRNCDEQLEFDGF